MSLINELLNTDSFNMKEIARMRSQIDRNLITFSEDENLSQLIRYLERAKEGDICDDESDSIVVSHAMDFLITSIIINAFDRREYLKDLL